MTRSTRAGFAVFVLALVAGPGHAGSASVSVSAATDPVPVVVPRGAPGAYTPAPGRGNFLTPAVERFRARFGSLQGRAWNARQRLLDRFYDNVPDPAAPAVPAAPAGRTPKASPIRFKDLVIQRGNFSEKTDISQVLADLLDRADATLDLQLHGLSLTNVAEALKRAKDRGVKIRILMNHSHVFPEKEGQKVSKEVQFLIDNKFEMRTLRGSGPYGVMHNKIAIVDGKILKLGSFNWTKAAATKNYENAVFFDAARKIARHQARFEELWAQARPVEQGALDAWGLSSQAPGAAAPDSEETVTFNGETFAQEMYSPNGGIKDALVRAIRATKSEIVIAMFSFNLDPVIDELIAAQKRGVKIRIVVDRSQSVSRGVAPEIQRMLAAGLDIRWTSGYAPGGVMHNKFAVFDRKLLAVGSYNWTFNAEEHNWENLNFTDEPELIVDFLEESEDLYNTGTRPTPQEAGVVEQMLEAGGFEPF